MKRLKRIGMPLFTLLLVLAVWEGCVHIFDIDLYILPAPSNIIQALFANRDILWMHSLVTLQEAVVGLLIATPVSYTHLDVYKRQVYSCLLRTYLLSEQQPKQDCGCCRQISDAGPAD